MWQGYQEHKRTAIIKADCECDLAEAEPAVDKATKALNTLNKKDISELKALSKPSAEIVQTMQCMLLLKLAKVDELSWNAAKKDAERSPRMMMGKVI